MPVVPVQRKWGLTTVCLLHFSLSFSLSLPCSFSLSLKHTHSKPRLCMPPSTVVSVWLEFEMDENIHLLLRLSNQITHTLPHSPFLFLFLSPFHFISLKLFVSCPHFSASYHCLTRSSCLYAEECYGDSCLDIVCFQLLVLWLLQNCVCVNPCPSCFYH